MYVPDVVWKDGTYYLMIGSGDREKPLGKASSTTAAYWPKSYATQNYFFMIEDRPTATSPTWLSTENGHCPHDVICLRVADADHDGYAGLGGPGRDERLVPRAERGLRERTHDTCRYESLRRAGGDLGHHRVRYRDVQHADAARTDDG